MNLLLFAAAAKLGHFKYRSWGEGRPGLIDKEGAQRERDSEIGRITQMGRLVSNK